MKIRRRFELGWGTCLLAGAVCAASCSSGENSTTTGTGRGGSTSAGGSGGNGGSGGAGTSGGSGGGVSTGGNGGTGGSGTTGGTGGTAGSGGTGGTGATGGAGATGGTGGAAGTTGTGGAAGSGGTAGTGGAAGKGGTTVDAGAPKDSGIDAGTVDTNTPPASCGDASTSGGAPFPPLTSYTASDGGFGPAVTTRNTGDGMLGSHDGGLDQVALFRPSAAKYGQGGVMHPIVVWGNGSTNTVDIWQRQLQSLATYGFVVVAPEQTQVTAAEMNAAIDYVIRLATDPNGSDCGKIDTTKIAAVGYSLGGIGAFSVAGNARIKATFIFDSNNAQAIPSMKAPWAIVSGDMDATFAWSAVKTSVTGSAQPAFGAAWAGGTHTTTPGQAKAWEAATGFLRWRLMGDQAGHDMFVGASCKICTDMPAFSEVVKSSTFDTL